MGGQDSARQLRQLVRRTRPGQEYLAISSYLHIYYLHRCGRATTARVAAATGMTSATMTRTLGGCISTEISTLSTYLVISTYLVMSDIYISTQVAAGEHQARVRGDGGPGQQVRIGSMCGIATSYCPPPAAG